MADTTVPDEFSDQPQHVQDAGSAVHDAQAAVDAARLQVDQMHVVEDNAYANENPRITGKGRLYRCMDNNTGAPTGHPDFFSKVRTWEGNQHVPCPECGSISVMPVE